MSETLPPIGVGAFRAWGVYSAFPSVTDHAIFEAVHFLRRSMRFRHAGPACVAGGAIGRPQRQMQSV
jgi:hypothetical protein